jgi:type IV pilus assembly protein PilV
MQEHGTIIDMKKSNEKGFALIEIMIAITVFTIGMLAVASMQFRAVKGNSFARGLTEATTLAQDRMEKLIGLFYTDPLLGGANTTATDHNDPDNPVYGRYDIFWNIAPDNPIKVKEIKVIVRWTDKGTEKSCNITSMKADI